MRFIAIILDPSRVWSDYAVVDTVRFTRMCICADCRDAETIAKVLNIQHVDRTKEALALIGDVSMKGEGK